MTAGQNQPTEGSDTAVLDLETQGAGTTLKQAIEPTPSCLIGEPCTLQDYATFLSAAIALNFTFLVWWDRIYDTLHRRRERSRNERDKKLASNDVVLEDDGGRANCDRFIGWARKLGRWVSGIMLIIIVGILLVFRSNSPLHFWGIASTILIGPILMVVTLFINWVWMLIVERDEKNILKGARLAKNKVADIAPSPDEDE